MLQGVEIGMVEAHCVAEAGVKSGQFNAGITWAEEVIP